MKFTTLNGQHAADETRKPYLADSGPTGHRTANAKPSSRSDFASAEARNHQPASMLLASACAETSFDLRRRVL